MCVKLISFVLNDLKQIVCVENVDGFQRCQLLTHWSGQACTCHRRSCATSRSPSLHATSSQAPRRRWHKAVCKTVLHSLFIELLCSPNTLLLGSRGCSQNVGTLSLPPARPLPPSALSVEVSHPLFLHSFVPFVSCFAVHLKVNILS